MAVSLAEVRDDATGAETPAAPRALIVSLYGLYARVLGGWLSVATLVRLMADLGVDEQATRSAIFRLKKRAWLDAEKDGRTAGYRASAEALAILAEGDDRIYGRRRAEADEGWLLVVFSVPESERDKRHQLRATLTRLGLGTIGPGTWVAPGHLDGAVLGALDRAGLRASGRADLCAIARPHLVDPYWTWNAALDQDYRGLPVPKQYRSGLSARRREQAP